jgi:hypothetical protein
MDNKQHFSAVAYSNGRIRVSSKEKLHQDKYIKFGEYDNFPNHLVELYNNSSIHETCVNAIIEAIKGDGLVAEPTFVLNKANSEGESWNDIFTKVAKDYYLFGGFYLEIIWNKLRTKISEVYHIPFTSVRSKEANHRGYCEGYYISHEWGIEEYGWRTEVENAVYLPAYNPKKKLEEPSQLYAFKSYRPLQRYYPLPHYVGALKVIELDTEVDMWHVSNIKNGLAPSVAITTFTNGTEEDRRAIENQLRTQYGGSSNAGQLFYMDVPSLEQKPTIEPIPQNGADTYYTTINDMVVQKILTAHRITSPMLLGIKTEGQLGGSQEMLDAYTLFLNMVIKPYQQEILACFEGILELQNPSINVVLGVEQKQILDTGVEEVDVITSKEAEAGEDAMLENDIEEAIDEQETAGL